MYIYVYKHDHSQKGHICYMPTVFTANTDRATWTKKGFETKCGTLPA